MTQPSRQQIVEALEALEALMTYKRFHKAQAFFPDTGPYARENYPNQMALMRAGKKHKIRAFIGGNASGKSLWQALETYFHMSGRYPHWWDGYRFEAPINAWLCSKDNKSLRDGIQEILFGGIGDDDIGTGILALEDLKDEKGHVQTWAMAGTANCIGQFRVRWHDKNGIFRGWSKCEFKTYDQGWSAFQGPTRQWIGFDEEPDDGKVFSECIMRLRPKDGGSESGHFLATFTPTAGFRETYLAFVPNGQYPEDGTHADDPSKYTCRVGWSASPHLTDEWKASAIANLKITDPNNIEARTEGYAAMGSGRVYPIDESFVVVPQQRIPSYWKKSYGIDPGQANFAVVWVAEDPNTGIKYVYDEYKHGKVVYILHVEAIKTRGEWMTGSIDPHEAVKPRDTGETVQSYLESSGLNLLCAKGDPDALRLRIRAMFDAGSLKIMSNCAGILEEIRTYRYDAKDPNKIAKNQNDHRLDALLYCICTFDSAATSYAEIEEEMYQQKHSKHNDQSDEGRNQYTGY